MISFILVELGFVLALAFSPTGDVTGVLENVPNSDNRCLVQGSYRDTRISVTAVCPFYSDHPYATSPVAQVHAFILDMDPATGRGVWISLAGHGAVQVQP